MTTEQIDLLARFGIFVTRVDYEHEHINIDGLRHAPRDAHVPTTITGEFRIDQHRFDPNCHWLRIMEMIIQSDNPAVQKTFEELITLLHLTDEGQG